MDWDKLVKTVTVEEVADVTPVEAPKPLIKLLEELRKPGKNGGKQRGTLDVSSIQEFEKAKRSLSAAARALKPPASVTTKGIYREEDLVHIPASEGVRAKTEAKPDAVPYKISFTVGEKRGRKNDGTDTE